MNSFYLFRNSEGAMRGRQFIAVSGNLLISRTLYFLGNTNELRNFSLTTQQGKLFICSFEYGLLLVLQDSWSLGLLVLETKWLSGMLRWQRVAGRVRDCVHSHRVVLYLVFGGEYALSPLMWTRSEIWASVSRAEFRSDRHCHFLGWHEAVPVEGMLNASNSYSTGIPCKKSIN